MVYCCFWDSSYSVSTYYIYSGDDVIAEYNTNGSLVWNYVYGLGQRLARYIGSTKQVYHNDHLGSVRALTDASGNVIGKEDYYPYGNKLAVTSNPGRFTYTGKELDEDWGFNLYYYGARFMDPATGRFMTPDPIKGTLNPYSYVANNPVNLIDPTGMELHPPERDPSNQPNFFKFEGYKTDPFFGVLFAWFGDDHYTTEEKEKMVDDAITDARRYCLAKVQSSTNEDTKKRYQTMADWLAHVHWSFYSLPDNVVAADNIVRDNTNGEFIRAELKINKNSIGGHPEEFLTSYIIGEAAHVIFESSMIPDIDWNKYPDNLSDLDKQKLNLFKEASEMVAWSYQILYMAFHVDMTQESKYPNDSGWYKIIRDFYKPGYPYTIDKIIKQYPY